MTSCCSADNFAFERAHTVGERFFMGVTTEEEDVLTAIPLTIFLDSPDGITRNVLSYLNGGTDGTLSVDTFSVEFEKTAEWSAENMAIGGEWRVRIAKGTADVDLQVIAEGVLNVILPPYGALAI